MGLTPTIFVPGAAEYVHHLPFEERPLKSATLMRLSCYREKRGLDPAALTDRAIDLNVEADVKPGV